MPVGGARGRGARHRRPGPDCKGRDEGEEAPLTKKSVHSLSAGVSLLRGFFGRGVSWRVVGRGYSASEWRDLQVEANGREMWFMAILFDPIEDDIPPKGGPGLHVNVDAWFDGAVIPFYNCTGTCRVRNDRCAPSFGLPRAHRASPRGAR